MEQEYDFNRWSSECHPSSLGDDRVVTEEDVVNRVGKRMPYSVPDGFFESLEENVMREVTTNASSTKKPTNRFTRWLTRGAVAAAIAGIVAFGGYKLAFKANATDSFAAVEQAFDNLNEEDQEFLLEVYQDDYFIADEIAEEDI